MFNDFFGEPIAIGDWIHPPRSDANWQMRFSQVESVGTTGKLLVRTYVKMHGMDWMMYPKLVTVHEPALVWKLGYGALPASLVKFMGQDLLRQEILKAKEAASADTKDSGKAVKRVKDLERVLAGGGELHSDGYIRYPHKPTLLGYD